MKRIVSFTLVLSMLVMTFCVRMAATEHPDLTGERLVVYISFHEEEGRRLLELFKERTNADYTYLRIPTGELVDRVLKEGSAPQADIILGGTADAHQLLANEGLLAKYLPFTAELIFEKFRSPDHYWTGIYLGAISIAINENRWKREFEGQGVEKPSTFEELLDPRFKGEIILPDPKTSGTGYTLLASLIQLWGEDEAFAYFRQLDQNVGEYTTTGFTVAQKTAIGDYLIGINFIHDQLLMKKSGFNLSSTIPPGAGWEIGCVSMIKNSQGSRAAESFLDFMAGREAGQLHTNLTERISTRSDVMTPLGARPWAEIPINLDYDLYWAAKLKTKYLRGWEERVLRIN